MGRRKLLVRGGVREERRFHEGKGLVRFLCATERFRVRLVKRHARGEEGPRREGETKRGFRFWNDYLEEPEYAYGLSGFRQNGDFPRITKGRKWSRQYAKIHLTSVLRNLSE